ncbi:MAG: hypothetical protein IPL55_24200 [Saprospiraceae bacterium]|nr:hypothetical protein [Saprospiraceae bacterium]
MSLSNQIGGFYTITHDDLTADGDLRYSFRVISPVAYEGNISSPGGKMD